MSSGATAARTRPRFSVTTLKVAPVPVEANGGGSFSPTLDGAVHNTADTMNGGGRLLTAFMPKTPLSEILNGGGSLSPTLDTDKATSDVLNGGGSFAEVTAPSWTHSAEANGGGSFTAVVARSFEVAVIANGGGSFAPTRDTDKATSPTLNGGGSFTVTWESTTPFSVELNGGGSIAPTLDTEKATSDTLNGGGSFAATAAKGTEGKTTSGILNGGGSFSATVTKAVDRTETLNGGGSFVAAAELVQGVAVTANGGGSFIVTTAPTRVVPQSEYTVDFNEAKHTGVWPQHEYGSGTWTVLDAGNKVQIDNNAWWLIGIPVIVSAGTELDFTFQSATEGEMQGIGVYSARPGMPPVPNKPLLSELNLVNIDWKYLADNSQKIQAKISKALGRK